MHLNENELICRPPRGGVSRNNEVFTSMIDQTQVAPHAGARTEIFSANPQKHRKNAASGVETAVNENGC